jgi:hypothetical protein
MALSLKKLGKIEKSLGELLAANPAALEEVTKQIAGVRAAMEAGETFTKADLNSLLGGEVEVTELPIETAAEDEQVHPAAPPLMELFKSLFADDGTIRKGQNMQTAQEAFEKAYQAVARTYDAGIDAAVDAAVEATAIELGVISKSGTGKKAPVDPEEEIEDMEKSLERLLKGTPGGVALLAKMAQLSTTVDTLRAERDTSVFAKQAADIGEPSAFGTELAKLHKLDPELAKTISKKLQVKNTLLAKSQAWGAELGEGGSQGGEGASAIEQMNQMAKEKVTKGEGKLTFAKAFTAVCQEQPDLYQRYQDEQRAARR